MVIYSGADLIYSYIYGKTTILTGVNQDRLVLGDYNCSLSLARRYKTVPKNIIDTLVEYAAKLHAKELVSEEDELMAIAA